MKNAKIIHSSNSQYSYMAKKGNLCCNFMDSALLARAKNFSGKTSRTKGKGSLHEPLKHTSSIARSDTALMSKEHFMVSDSQQLLQLKCSNENMTDQNKDKMSL